jgi:hypothetical protein
MRQKLGVALAVVALALSGAREASDQFHQLKSLAGGWATTNAWNSLLVYAAGTFDGRAPQRRTTLIASNYAAGGEAKSPRARRAAKPATRKPARARVGAAEPAIAELALSFDGAGTRRSDVEEFRIEVSRDAGAKAAALVRPFAAADFETELAREASRGGEVARAQLASEMSKLRGGELVFKFAQVETLRARPPHRRPAPRRKVEEPRDEAAHSEQDGDAQDVLFDAPSPSGLLNCDEEPRR